MSDPCKRNDLQGFFFISLSNQIKEKQSTRE